MCRLGLFRQQRKNLCTPYGYQADFALNLFLFYAGFFIPILSEFTKKNLMIFVIIVKFHKYIKYFYVFHILCQHYLRLIYFIFYLICQLSEMRNVLADIEWFLLAYEKNCINKFLQLNIRKFIRMCTNFLYWSMSDVRLVQNIGLKLNDLY